MPYRGHDDQAVWACAIARTTWPLHCQIAPWKSNEALFFFCGQKVWNLLISTEEWRFSMETVVWVRGECMNGWKDFKTEDKMSVMNTRVGDQLAWQLRQWNSRLSSVSVTTGEWVTIDEIAIELNMSHGSAYSIVHDDLGYRKVCSRWVPRQLVVWWSQVCTADDLSGAFGPSCLWRRCFFPSNCDRRWFMGVPLWTRE